jgi:hypothetical protein
MRPFVVSVQSSLSVGAAWARITDWPTHARWVPLTTIEVTTPLPNGVGTVFNAHTALGRLGFDDPMEIVSWRPPADGAGGTCRLEKRGRMMLGWAELTVDPRGDGSVATWTEAAKPAHLPAFTDAVSSLAGRLLFGRVLRKLLDA